MKSKSWLGLKNDQVEDEVEEKKVKEKRQEEMKVFLCNVE
jgi:hypothetical protein